MSWQVIKSEIKDEQAWYNVVRELPSGKLIYMKNRRGEPMLYNEAKAEEKAAELNREENMTCKQHNRECDGCQECQCEAAPYEYDEPDLYELKEQEQDWDE